MKPQGLPHTPLVRGEWVPYMYCPLFSWYLLCSGYFLRGIDVWHKDLHILFQPPSVHLSLSWNLPHILSPDLQPYSLQAPCLDKLFATAQRAMQSLSQATSSSKQSWCQIAYLQLCPPDFFHSLRKHTESTMPSWFMLTLSWLLCETNCRFIPPSLSEPSMSPQVWAKGGISSAKAGDTGKSFLHT